MKKLFIFSICVIFCLFVGCGKLNKTSSPSLIETTVAAELEKLDNNYSDETLKALSVIIRTNLHINNKLENQINNPSEKYSKIASSTKNKVLKKDDGTLVELSLENSDNYKWQKSIKKSKLLEFALKNGISLTNIKNISPELKNDKVVGLKVGNKYFDYQTLANEFDLESNIIENITESKSEIFITGKQKGFFGSFDFKTAEKLSNNNQDFVSILKYFFEDLKIDFFNC